MSDTGPLTVDIRSWDNEGRGIADLPDGKVCFVEGAIPGETVVIDIVSGKRNYSEGVVRSIVTASPHRVGQYEGSEGAGLAHVDYEGQLDFKYNRVRDCLIRIGGISEDEADRVMRPVIPADRTVNYRNHMQYRIMDGRICEMRRGSNEPVPVIDNPVEYKIFGKVRSILEKVFEDAPTNLFSGVVLRGSERTHQIMIEMVSDDRRSHELVIRDASAYVSATDLAGKLAEGIGDNELTGLLLRISPDRTSSRTRTGKRVILSGVDYYTENLCGRTFRVKAGAFFQVNVEQAEKLYAAASEGLTGARTVYDVYCGTGTIGLSCVDNGKQLIGIESVREAVESARINAELSGMSNARFICRPAEKVEPEKEGLPAPDAVIVDPPRKGMDPLVVRRLMELAPPSLSYISCDPATMARDLRTLSKAYRIGSVTPVDMFCQTAHVETVVRLSRLIEEK